MKTHFFSLLGVLAIPVLLLPPSVQALTLDFETGYTTGSNLDGQPSSGTQWSGGGSDFQVIAGAGTVSSNAVVTQSKASGTTNSLFSPTGLDLPGFNGTSSILEVGFQFRFTGSVLTEESTQTVAAIQFGFNGADVNVAARFHLLADGRLGYYRGTVITHGTNVTFDPNEWNSVVATLDYNTQTFSFTLNGQQVIRSEIDEFNFRGSTTGTGIRFANTGSTNWTPVAFDNIYANVVPEPSIVFLISGVGVLFGLKRKPNRNRGIRNNTQSDKNI